MSLRASSALPEGLAGNAAASWNFTLSPELSSSVPRLIPVDCTSPPPPSCLPRIAAIPTCPPGILKSILSDYTTSCPPAAP